MKNSVFSSPQQLKAIAKVLVTYSRMPFASLNIPGAAMEAVLAHVRGGVVLRTYDFVDVVNQSARLGWQIKSTLAKTPVTWKRAKIPNSLELIERSRSSKKGLQQLGGAIIDFCNRHAQESLELYDLKAIGYSRLLIKEDRTAIYFERELCNRERPWVFRPQDFVWKWSEPKSVVKKEQLPALHGYRRDTRQKWFAWHGLGENQLHFSGESAWWPVGRDRHKVEFRLPSESAKLSLEGFVELIAVAVTPKEVGGLSEESAT